jgi:hypothetical protein
MLRCSAVTRVAAGAAKRPTHDASSQLTRALPSLSLAPHLAEHAIRTSITRSFARAIATEAVKARTSRTATHTTKSRALATTTKKPKAKAAAKPKPKKKKVVAKKKAVAKKKKVAPKKKAAPKRKVLTERQKTLAEKKKEREGIIALKAAALVEPKTKPDNAWVVFMSEFTKEGTGPVTTKIKDAAVKFKALSASELEVRVVRASPNQWPSADRVASTTTILQTVTKRTTRPHTRHSSQATRQTRFARRISPEKHFSVSWGRLKLVANAMDEVYRQLKTRDWLRDPRAAS